MVHRPGHQVTVLHIFSGDLWAGAEVMVYHLICKLKEDKNFKVIAFSLNEGTLVNRLRSAGVEVSVIPEIIFPLPIILQKAYSSLKEKNIDIIHSHRSKENFLALCLAKILGGTSLVTTLHGLPEPFVYRTKRKARAKTWLNYFILKRYFDRVVAVSSEIREALISKHHFNTDKLEFIHNGIPLPHNTLITKDLHKGCFQQPTRFHIGTVGRMVPVKNFGLFLEIAAAISKQMQKVQFSIMGDGPLKVQLSKKIKELHLENLVRILPPSLDPFPFYQSLDLYLNTSLHEGIPLTILEAMACGKPIVAPRLGGIPEMITHSEHGFLINDSTASSFSDACIKLMENENLRVTFGENAFKKISTCFTDYRMAQAYKTVYQKLCKPS